MKENRQKILITGGLGFIGSEILKELSLNNEVIVLDIAKEIPSHLKGYAFSHLCKDICDVAHEDLKGVDIIIHEAAKTSVPHSFEDEEEFYRVNVLGTHALLKACAKANVKKFIYASSSSVYGDTSGIVNENGEISCLSPYAYQKYQGELLCESFARKFKIDCVVLRYFNAIGPFQNPSNPYSGVITKFIDRIKDKLPLIIHGDGKQYRDFVHVNDIAKANMLAIDYSPTSHFEIFNIASGIQTSVLQVAKMLGGFNYPICFEEKRQGDFNGNAADIKKAKQKLHFQAQYNVEGICEWIPSVLSVNHETYERCYI